MRKFMLTAFMLFCAAGFGLSCGESEDDVCNRACDRWVNQCGRWNMEDCMAQCRAEGDWDDYADCLEEAPCNALDAFCEG
jgi:hypothetical protein